MGAIVSFLVCAVLVIVISKVVFKGTKSIFGFLINIAAGGFALLILDLIGLGVPITWVTAGIVGLLGVPGVVIVAVMKYVFKII